MKCDYSVLLARRESSSIICTLLGYNCNISLIPVSNVSDSRILTSDQCIMFSLAIFLLKVSLAIVRLQLLLTHTAVMLRITC